MALASSKRISISPFRRRPEGSPTVITRSPVAFAAMQQGEWYLSHRTFRISAKVSFMFIPHATSLPKGHTTLHAFLQLAVIPWLANALLSLETAVICPLLSY